MKNPKAVIGTNSWGSAAYEKIIRGSVINNDTLKEAMKAAVKSNLLFVDSARNYGFGKSPKPRRNRLLGNRRVTYFDYVTKYERKRILPRLGVRSL